MAKSISDYVRNAGRKVRESIEKKMRRLDERYDFCITDSRKKLSVAGDYAIGSMRVAAPVAGAIVLALNAVGCKLPSGGDDPIRNTPPRITSTPKIYVNEGTLYQDQIIATDAEGNPIIYTSPVTPAWRSVNPATGLASGPVPQVEKDTPYDIVNMVSDGIDSTTQSYTLIVKDTSGPDYVDLTGKVGSDTRPGVGEKAKVKFYVDGQPINIQGTSSHIALTDSSGNFSVTLNRLVNPADKLTIETIATDPSGNEYTSWIRTIDNLPAVDTNLSMGSDIRANPAARVTLFDSDLNNDGYPDIDSNRDHAISSAEKGDYVTQIGRVSFYSDAERIAAGLTGFLNGNPYHGLKRWNWGERSDTSASPRFRGAKIANSAFVNRGMNPNDIITGIRTSGDPRANEINLEVVEDPQYQRGWVNILPAALGDGPSTVVYDQLGSDGYPEGATVYLNTTDKKIVNHEFWGHAVRFVGHSSGPGVPALLDCIMKHTSPSPSEYTPFNLKAVYTLGDPTHIGMEAESKILGRTCLDGESIY